MSAIDLSLPVQRDIVAAIRSRGGRATLGDLMAATSRQSAEIEGNVLPALNQVGGHVAVDEHGELIYSVEGQRKLPKDPWLGRWWRALARILKALFVAGLTLVLVGYFIFYIVLAIAVAVAAIAAASRGGDADCDCDCDCKGCDACGDCAVCCDASTCNGCGDTCAACFTCGGPEKRARARARNAERRKGARDKKEARRVKRSERRAKRMERRQRRLANVRSGLGLTQKPAYLGMVLERERVEEKPPFFRAVRDFVFGPPRPLPDPLALERNALAYIRAHDGRVAASDMVMLTGLPLAQADAVLLDLATRYQGDIEVTDDATILYTFDRLMVSTRADAETLDWIASQGHSVSVEDFARHHQIPASEALARLQHVAQAAGGRAEHGATTRFVFPKGASDRAWELAAVERDYVYCWEDLEVSPAIIGLPEGGSGWVVGFNVANLVLGTLVLANLAWISDLLSIDFTGTAAWFVAYLPLAFSASVFLIPLVRTIVRAFTNRGRRKRNAHRVVLLGLFHALEGDDDKVTARELSETLFGTADFRQFPHLEAELRRLVDELEGDIDMHAPLSDEGKTYTFTKVFDELHAVHHARLKVDLSELQLTTLVYDTSREDAEQMGER